MKFCLCSVPAVHTLLDFSSVFCIFFSYYCTPSSRKTATNMRIRENTGRWLQGPSSCSSQFWEFFLKVFTLFNQRQSLTAYFISVFGLHSWIFAMSFDILLHVYRFLKLHKSPQKKMEKYIYSRVLKLQQTPVFTFRFPFPLITSVLIRDFWFSNGAAFVILLS